MSRISKQSVHAALEKAGKNILAAAGEDAFISRADIRRKVKELKGVEADLTDIFYRFIDARDYKKGARVTKADVDDALAYAKEKLINKYDLNQNGLSKKEIQAMSTTGKLAVALAYQLKEEGGGLKAITDPATWKKELDALVKDLIYMGPGSESEDPLHAVYFPALAGHLNTAAVIKALELDITQPAEIIYSLRQKDRLLTPSRTFDLSTDDYNGFAKAQKVNAFAARYLRSFGEVIIGEDGVIVEHPFYLLGLTADGAIAGLQTKVIWT